MITEKIEGLAALEAQLRELADPKQFATTLRASVREPLRLVLAQARANIARISPGKAELHRTYKGRLVSAGFAARSLRILVKLSPDKQAAIGVIGVLKEAYYALMFFELGTAHIPAQPWLRPALESQKSVAVQKMAAVLKKRIDAIARKRARGPTVS
jgi:HK97 gp10 family phage protein